MQRTIKAALVGNVLVPSPEGQVNVTVENKDGSGIISFGGANRAVVTYDSTGNRVISHLSMGVDDTADMQQSIENIVAAM